MSSRKRAAPGADVPNPPQQQPIQDFNFDGQNFDWSGADPLGAGLNSTYIPQPGYDGAFYNNGVDPSGGLVDQNGNMLNDAGALVVRNPSSQLVSRGRTWQEAEPYAQQSAAWETDDEADIEQQALAAKRDAQAKRKSIPPFIQKLSSFLDESNNTDLIRWSDDGRSFIVLDEEEFAKTLIPELFKHNNYASFVRQLNMYGFHKKVGLSDNSMKASENKRKTPSEYWNKYFRRGRPELLWLIQKPKTVPAKNRKNPDGTKGEHSDDEKKPETTQYLVQSGPDTDKQELTTIPKTELSGLKQELVNLQRSQKLISTYIAQIKRQNDQLYQQAGAFQAMHDRHESSINAILTFLATFYNRSLEGHGPPNFADMFKQAIASQNQNQQPQGNIVEMPDLPNVELNLPTNPGNPPMNPPGRRRPLLLPAPDPKTSTTTTTATTTPATRNANLRTHQTVPEFRSPNSARFSTPESSIRDKASPVQTIKTESATPQPFGGAEDMLSVINAANANSPATASYNDFNSALDHVQHGDGNTPLTPQQRKDVLSLMANQSNADAGPNPSLGSGLVNDFMKAPVPDPSLPKGITQTHEQLQMLQKLQDEQAAKVANLAERLGPLSPNGSIPGFYDANVNGTPIPAPDWNLDDWINDGTNASTFDYDPSLPPDASYSDLGIALNDNEDGSKFTLGQDDDDDDDNDSPTFGDHRQDLSHLNTGSGGRVESLTSRETTPAMTGDEATEQQQDGGSDRKRRRTDT